MLPLAVVVESVDRSTTWSGERLIKWRALIGSLTNQRRLFQRHLHL